MLQNFLKQLPPCINQKSSKLLHYPLAVFKDQLFATALLTWRAELAGQLTDNPLSAGSQFCNFSFQ